MLLGDRVSVVKMLLIINCILFITFLSIDLSLIEIHISSSVIKYISIVICFLMSLLTGRKYLDKTDILLLQLGLFTTLIADFSLIFTDYIELGVGVFSIVHIVYVIRYKRNKIRAILICLTVIFHIIVITYLILNYFISKIDLLFGVALFYSISLIFSFVGAIKAYKHKSFPYPNKYLIAWGMLLFLLCDINVGISNITRLTNNSIGIISVLKNISGFLIWFFYLPSQVLLSLSGYDFKELSNKYRTGDTL